MEQLWVVAWQSKASGANGRDEKEMTREECIQTCTSLNNTFPRWHHYPAKADDKPKLVKKKKLEPIPDKKQPRAKAEPKPKKPPKVKLTPGDATALVSKLLKGII